jgi:photosystem II stability/assembly factor-like uncharacterized protein
MSQSRIYSRAPIAQMARWWRSAAALLVVALLLAACAGPSADATAIPPQVATETPTVAATETPSQPDPSAAPVATDTRTPKTATPAHVPLLTATPRLTPTITPTRRPTSTPNGPTETPVALASQSSLTRLGDLNTSSEDKVLPLLAAGGKDGTTLFAASAGVMRSLDSGATWNAVRSEKEAPKVTALAVAPSKPEVVYVGVSEGCTITAKQPGYMSSDGGTTWKAFGNSIVSLAVDPKNASTIYATDCEGLKRSTNSGQDWETLTAPKISRGTRVIFGIAPGNTDHLYIAVPVGASTMVIIHSADRGATWKGITPSIVANMDSDQTLPGGDKFVAKSAPLGIAIDAQDPLIALVSTTYGVFRTTDAGATWKRLDAGLEGTVPQGVLPRDQDGSRLNTALVADPERTGAFWVGTGAEKVKGVGLYRTRNSGESWRKPIAGLEGKQIYALALGGTARERVLYIATDDGVWSLTAP